MQIETVSRDPLTLRVLCPAKLNLVLHVRERAGEYHSLDSIFQAVSLHDELTLERTEDGNLELTLLVEPAPVAHPGLAPENNLVTRAARAFREAFAVPEGLGARISLLKCIPLGSGLGGGSSDAAATLVALARLWAVREATRPRLAAIAERLGADVPFFLHGGTARCRGKGELVEPYPAFLDGAPEEYVIAYPGIHVSSGAVFAEWDRLASRGLLESPPAQLLDLSCQAYRRQLAGDTPFFNSLEAPSRRLRPELDRLADLLQGPSFRGSAMTGSGSAFFARPRVGTAEEAARRLRPRLAAELGEGAVVFAARSLPAPHLGWLPAG